MPSFAHSTAVQLSLIQELATVLQAARIPYRLFGGWGVDFLVGEITRPHSDVDLILWRRDAPAIRRILGERGYAGRPSPSGPELDARFCKQDQLVEIMFLQEQEGGGACWGDWRLPPDALAARDGRLGEISCPVVSPRLLLGCKGGGLGRVRGGLLRVPDPAGSPARRPSLPHRRPLPPAPRGAGLRSRATVGVDRRGRRLPVPRPAARPPPVPEQ